jgi:hypothetical protein
MVIGLIVTLPVLRGPTVVAQDMSARCPSWTVYAIDVNWFVVLPTLVVLLVFGFLLRSPVAKVEAQTRS